jgi:prepilin-type N-terminal cleavage/methylation domain-containing protein/prepilin-type processing-associated H-X9-DG protein
MMTSLPSSRRARAGFTLIELLTVIAIIGILASILIPTVGSVRENARNTQCVNTLRSWATAINLYSLENRGTYYVVSGNRAWSQISTGAGFYSKYFGRNARLDYGDMLFCPTEEVARTIANNGGNTPDYTCYVMIWGTINGAPARDGAAIPFARATEPARTILMLERNFTATAGATLGPGNAYSINDAGTMRTAYANFKRHGGKFNVAFFDGHVSRMKWDDGGGKDSSSLSVNPNGSGRNALNVEWLRIDK